MTNALKIGTRASPLALAQVDLFIKYLQDAHPEFKNPGTIEIFKIVTSGDKSQTANTPLIEQDAGGKALFAKEIEEALLDGTIDCAVHSMKDMPPVLPDGLSIPCYLPRGDTRDAFFSPKAATLNDLPEGAVVGTSSPRRQAILLAHRPDLKVEVFRGNVETRLRKLESGVVDATLLAVAGLIRLGMTDKIQHTLETDEMLPAAGQGTVGIEIRTDNDELQKILHAVNCKKTEIRTAAERAYLRVMNGSCKTPLAAYMDVPNASGQARFEVMASNEDGSALKHLSYTVEFTDVENAIRTGEHAGHEMQAAQAA